MSTSNDEYTRLVDVQSNDIYIKKMNVYILTLSNKKKDKTNYNEFVRNNNLFQ
jgi:hypothetical protein